MTFLLCDDVREERNGKLIMVGIYVGDNVILPKGVEPGGVLPMLTLWVLLRGYSGLVPVQLVLEDPGGAKKTLVEDEVSVKDGENHSLTVRMPGFQVTSFGEFRIALQLGEEEHCFIFKIQRQGDPP